jgi:hypothetical protein
MDIADIALLSFGVVGSSVIVGYVATVAYKARGSRPVMLSQCETTKEKSASSVDLSKYVDAVAKNFSHSMDWGKSK